MKLLRNNGHIRTNDFVIPAEAGIQSFWARASAGATDLIAAGVAL